LQTYPEHYTNNNIPIVTKSKVVDQLLYTLKILQTYREHYTNNIIPIVAKSKVVDQLLYTLKILQTYHEHYTNNIIQNFLSNNHSCKYQHKVSLHIFKFNNKKLSLVLLIYGFFVD
jgi:hypothetical protein